MAKIQIADNHEPLVKVRDYCPKVVIDVRFGREAYLRKTIAEMLHKASKYLPEGIQFILHDAWRPKKIQDRLRVNFEKRLRAMHPELSGRAFEDQLDKYVAPSSGYWASGHMCGGAVDIRLIKKGRRLPMKDRKNLSYEENALSVQSKLPKYIQKNRKILSKALTKAGFCNIPHEFWHWSYGDKEWAIHTGRKTAFYGVVNLKQ